MVETTDAVALVEMNKNGEIPGAMLLDRFPLTLP